MNVAALANIIAGPMMMTIGYVKTRIAITTAYGLSTMIAMRIMRKDRRYEDGKEKDN